MSFGRVGSVCCERADQVRVSSRLAFPFDALMPESLVVDVGGGIGSTSMRLAEAHPGLRFVIQDREAVCALGMEVSFGVVAP